MGEPMRFYRWDYDNDTLIEYEREGECNMCGQCCMAYIFYRVAGKRTPGKSSAMGDGVDGTGVWAGVSQGRMTRYVKLLEVSNIGGQACPAYRFNGCTEHAKKSLRMDGKLALCAAWPMIPDQVELFDECSYSFVEIGRWKISDIGKRLDEKAEATNGL